MVQISCSFQYLLDLVSIQFVLFQLGMVQLGEILLIYRELMCIVGGLIWSGYVGVQLDGVGLNSVVFELSLEVKNSIGRIGCQIYQIEEVYRLLFKLGQVRYGIDGFGLGDRDLIDVQLYISGIWGVYKSFRIYGNYCIGYDLG